MLIIYTSDLHGNERLYRDLFGLAERENAEAVILGGDLLPGVGAFEGTLQRQRAFIEGFLADTLERWTTLLPRLQVFALMGNDDWAINMDALQALEARGILKPLHLRLHALAGGFEIMGCSFVPPTPFSMKDWERRDLRTDLAQVPFSYARFQPCISTPQGIEPVEFHQWFDQRPSLAELLATLPSPCDWRQTLCVFHGPPYNTKLDVLENGKPIGSKAIRDFILRHQPLMSLHGHIHESPYVSGSYRDRLGQTICVNPGQGGKQLHAVLFDLADPPGTLRHTVFG